MSYLSSTAQIDAILTRRGRALLASGNFNPTKFALSDDYVDYGLLALEDGESLILETKIPEASSLGSDSNTQLKYKLIIDDSGKIIVPTLDIQPISVGGTIYQSFIVRIETIFGGVNESYTVYNNYGGLTINPARAIIELQKQKYITSSGKDYASINNTLQNYVRVYPVIPFDQNNFQPEQVITRKIGTDSQHSFFIFANEPFATAQSIRIVGNNSGAVANFTVNAITIIPEADTTPV